MHVDLNETMRVTLIVKANDLRSALSQFVVKARGVFYNFHGATELGVIGQYAIYVDVPMGTYSQMATRFNEWLCEDVGTVPPYPNGSLLFWNSEVPVTV